MKKTREQISKNMRSVRNKDSQIELALRKELWKRNLRYRKNVNQIFGKPDIAFIGLKIAIFVDSEFWHGYDWQNKQTEIKSNREFWISKIERNMQRDLEVTQKLQNDGWTVIRIWGKDIKKNVSSAAADRLRDIAVGDLVDIVCGDFSARVFAAEHLRQNDDRSDYDNRDYRADDDQFGVLELWFLFDFGILS